MTLPARTVSNTSRAGSAALLRPRKAMTAMMTAAILAATGIAGADGALADEKDSPKPGVINVTGEGHVDLAPDMAVLDLGVMREAATAREALSANNEAMAEVIAAMKEAGIEARDLQTSGFSIQPRYVHHTPKQGEEHKPPRIVGYVVSNNLTVRIRDLDAVGTVLDRSVTLGVNSGGSIRFANDDPSAAITEARRKAMEDAIARARTLSEAAGVGIGRILTIDESFSRPAPFPMARGRMMAEAAMADAVPIEGGENTYRVNVTVSFEIDQ